LDHCVVNTFVRRSNDGGDQNLWAEDRSLGLVML
jgi:hypothetical protein